MTEVPTDGNAEKQSHEDTKDVDLFAPNMEKHAKEVVSRNAVENIEQENARLTGIVLCKEMRNPNVNGRC